MVTKRIDLEQTPTTLDEVLSMVGPDTEIILLRGPVIVARIYPGDTTIEKRWDDLFSQSQDVLASMADNALSDHRRGKTLPLDTDETQ